MCIVCGSRSIRQNTWNYSENKPHTFFFTLTRWTAHSMQCNSVGSTIFFFFTFSACILLLYIEFWMCVVREYERVCHCKPDITGPMCLCNLIRFFFYSFLDILAFTVADFADVAFAFAFAYFINFTWNTIKYAHHT